MKKEAQYIEITECGDKFYYKDKAMTIVHRLDGPAIEYSDGYKQWYVGGKCHRLDGPAVEYAEGSKEWWVDDKLHRIDGPAVEYSNGDKAWWVDGKCHRVDGPAVEYSNGCKSWHINGECLSEDEWKQRTTVKETILTLDDIAAKFGVDVKTLKIVKEH